MEQLIDIAFSSSNVVITSLLLFLVVYWLITMISGIDFDLDLDFDISSNVNIEGNSLEIEDLSNTEVNKDDVVKDRRNSLKWWQIALIYFNFVGLPFMFTFTCWIFVWWFITVFFTALTYSYDNTFGHLLFLAGMFPSLIIAKIITTPFKSFFQKLNKEGDKPIDLLGSRGIIMSTISGTKLGSAKVVAQETPMDIYVKSIDGKEIKYNQKILIIQQSEDKNYYLVEVYQE